MPSNKTKFSIASLALTVLLSYVQMYTFTDAGKTKKDDWLTHQNQLLSTTHEINTLKIGLTSDRKVLLQASDNPEILNTQKHREALNNYNRYLTATYNISGQYTATGVYLRKEVDSLNKKMGRKEFPKATKKTLDAFAKNIDSMKSDREVLHGIKSLVLSISKEPKNAEKPKTTVKKGKYVISMTREEYHDLYNKVTLKVDYFDIPADINENAKDLLVIYSDLIKEYNSQVNFDERWKNLIILLMGFVILLCSFGVFLIDNKEPEPEGTDEADETTTS